MDELPPPTDPAPSPPELTDQELALANISEASSALNSGVQTDRAEIVLEDAEKVKAAAQRAKENQALSAEQAEEIVETADKIEAALEKGDAEAAVEESQEINKKVEEAVVEQKGQQVAKKLQKADDEMSEPVLSDPEEAELLRAAATEVIMGDDKIPEEDREAAVEYAVRAMTEGLEGAGTTNEEFIDAVEAEAANLEPEQPEEAELSAETTELDRHGGYDYWHSWRPSWYYRHRYPWRPRWWHRRRWWGHRGRRRYGRRRWWGRGRRHWGRRRHYWDRRKRSTATDRSYGYYYPYYYRGYGYRQCLYWFSSPYCRRRLYSDYLYYYPFHSFYRRYAYYYG